MSLYHHFPNKDELLAAMLGMVFEEMEHPPTTDDWRADVRRCSLSARDALLRHEWACQMLGQPALPSQAQLEWMESCSAGCAGPISRRG